MNKDMIAVFGGAFNPPTIAHISLANQILNKMNEIEKIIFVPVSTKYNKKGLASNEDRINMLKKISRANRKFEVSTVEIDSPKQLYTIETLRILKKENPHKKICFILGTDNLKELETWFEIETMLNEFKILVLKRNNDNIQKIIQENQILNKHKEAFIEIKDIDTISLSSSIVRKKIEKNENISNLVPNEIIENIKKIYKK